jgi:insertion element IS1 protein InsB
VNQSVLQHLHPEQIEVEIWRADALEVRRGLSSELDEMWSYVRSKANPRWLWHAIDHHTGKVLAYVFGRRQDTVFLELKALLEPFGISRYFTDGWGPTSGMWKQSSTRWGRHIRRRSKASTLICGRGSSGWSAGRSAFRRRNACMTW